MPEDLDRTAHWGNCSGDCGVAIVIYAVRGSESDLPDPAEWETEPFYMDCPVCGETIDWGGTDHPRDILKHW